MDKSISFKWVSFLGDDEYYISSYSEARISVNHIFTKLTLNQIEETARYIENFKGTEISAGANLHNVFISGLNTPIRLAGALDVGEYCNLYLVSNKGPTVQWLLNHKEEINNPSPNRTLYVDNMAIQFTFCDYVDSRILVTILSTEDIDEFIDMVDDTYIQWLGKTFDAFTATYGYTDEDTVRRVSEAIAIFHAAKELGFEDPIKVTSNLVDKRLVADLIMKGVFDNVKSCY